VRGSACRTGYDNDSDERRLVERDADGRAVGVVDQYDLDLCAGDELHDRPAVGRGGSPAPVEVSPLGTTGT
jgi:hypothetical protein